MSFFVAHANSPCGESVKTWKNNTHACARKTTSARKLVLFYRLRYWIFQRRSCGSFVFAEFLDATRGYRWLLLLVSLHQVRRNPRTVTIIRGLHMNASQILLFVRSRGSRTKFLISRIPCKHNLFIRYRVKTKKSNVTLAKPRIRCARVCYTEPVYYCYHYYGINVILCKFNTFL